MAQYFEYLPGLDTEITPFLRGVQATDAGHVRDRFNNLLPVNPGDYVVQLGDGSLTVFTQRAAEATITDYEGAPG